MNKLVYLTILLYSLSFSEEIWEKEIPPSKYLEKLVTEREALRKNNLKYILTNWTVEEAQIGKHYILRCGD